MVVDGRAEISRSRDLGDGFVHTEAKSQSAGEETCLRCRDPGHEIHQGAAPGVRDIPHHLIRFLAEENFIDEQRDADECLRHLA